MNPPTVDSAPSIEESKGEDIRRLLVLKLSKTGWRGRDLDSGSVLSIRGQSYNLAMLDTVIFRVEKQWSYMRTTYYSGTVIRAAFDLASITVEGHHYTKVDTFDARSFIEEYEIDDGTRACIGTGERPCYEFDDYTGADFYAKDSDPVYESTTLETFDERYNLLTKLWEEYPPCIDALVHIASLYFDSYGLDRCSIENCLHAARHIAERHMDEQIQGSFLWSAVYNRPYLRALYLLCMVYWRAGQFAEARAVACRLLYLNPPDNQGVRYLLANIEAGIDWKEAMEIEHEQSEY